MEKDSIRVVIDTNIWIGFLIGKTLSGLFDAVMSDKISVLFSEELFEELIEVLLRPKFEKYFSQENIAELISLLHFKTEQIKISEHFLACRDSKDNFLLELCILLCFPNLYH